MPRSVRIGSSVTGSNLTHIRNKGRNPRTPNASGFNYLIVNNRVKPMKLATTPVCELRVLRGDTICKLSLDEAFERKVQALRELNGNMSDTQMRHIAIYLVNNEQNFPIRAESKSQIIERRTYGSLRGKAAVLLAQNGYRSPQFIKSLEDIRLCAK